jgi:hypothetical protein
VIRHPSVHTELLPFLDALAALLVSDYLRREYASKTCEGACARALNLTHCTKPFKPDFSNANNDFPSKLERRQDRPRLVFHKSES